MKLFLFLFIPVLAHTPVNAQADKPQLSELKWISGCWEINKPDEKILISEQWMGPEGKAMMGMSRTVRDGKMTGYEFLRIVEDDSGIHYISKPHQNRDDTAFKLVKWKANDVTFENPAHDFPQRIIYRLTKPDALTARIEGTRNGKTSGVDFSFVRTKCG